MRQQNGTVFWQIYANVYDLVRFLPPYKNLLQEVKKTAEIKPDMKILDAGCGTGNFMRLTAPDIKAEFEGFDVSDIMLKKARKKLANIKNVTLSLGNLNDKLSFPNHYFDRIIATNSIYAVKDPEFSFSELYRVLKPKGIIVIVNPHAHAKFFNAYFEILNSGKGLEKIFLFFVTIPLFFFNMMIKMKADKKNFHFLSMRDWEKVVQRFKIKSVTFKETYMQSYLLKIIKND